MKRKFFTLCYRFGCPKVQGYPTLKEAKEELLMDSDDDTSVLIFNLKGKIVYITDFYKDHGINDRGRWQEQINRSLSIIKKVQEEKDAGKN